MCVCACVCVSLMHQIKTAVAAFHDGVYFSGTSFVCWIFSVSESENVAMLTRCATCRAELRRRRQFKPNVKECIFMRISGVSVIDTSGSVP